MRQEAGPTSLLCRTEAFFFWAGYAVLGLSGRHLHISADSFRLKLASHLGLALARLSRKFIQKLRYGRERPKVDESCGRGSSLGPQYCTGEQNSAFAGSKTSNSLKKARAACARKPDHTSKIRIFAKNNAENEDPAKMTHSIMTF